MTFFRNLCAAASLLLSATVSAGTASGTITQLIVRASDGLVYVHLSGTPQNRPACAAKFSYWMIKDENSETGRRQLAMLMMAQASGKAVHITGSNTCTRWADGEDINLLQI